MISDKKNRAILAIEDVENAYCEQIGDGLFVSKNFPQLVVQTSMSIAEPRHYLKRQPSKDRDMLYRAVSNIMLHKQGHAVETFLIESDTNLYLVKDRVRTIADTSTVDLSILAQALSAMGFSVDQTKLKSQHVGYAYEEVSGGITAAGAGSETVSLGFVPAFVKAEYADWQIQVPALVTTEVSGSDLTVSWNTSGERPIRWMAYKETSNPIIFDSARMFPFRMSGLDVDYLSQYIDLNSPLEDTMLRDENLWIQDEYLALMDIIKTRQWMRYFNEGHFDVMFDDISVSMFHFQYYYNYTLMLYMRDLVQNDPEAAKRFASRGPQ